MEENIDSDKKKYMLYNAVHWSNPSISEAKYVLWQHQAFVARKKDHVKNGYDKFHVPGSLPMWVGNSVWVHRHA